MRKVLVVDDDAIALDVYQAAVSSLGYACLTVDNGQGALQILSDIQDVNIIISDINMPGLDGITLLKEIEARFMDHRPIVCILITAQTSLDKAVEAIRHSAIDFLSKSDVLSEIGSALRRASLKLSRLESRLPKSGNDGLYENKYAPSEEFESVIKGIMASETNSNNEAIQNLHRKKW